MQTTFWHLVPRFPPMLDGVGDYALNLARFLRDGHGIASGFLVADPKWPVVNQFEGFPVHKLATPTAAGLTACLANTGQGQVFLHYVGYGYSPRGLPRWLIAALAELPPGRLTTFFHELWASGTPWGSAFWLRPFQKHLAFKLARCSRSLFTSNRRMAAMIKNRVHTVPIPSNIAGRTSPLSSAPGNAPWRIVVFGQAPNRLRNLAVHEKFLRALNKRGLLAQVILVGDGVRGLPQPSAEVAKLNQYLLTTQIDLYPNASPAQVVQCFVQADFGLWHYPASLLAKSTVFMTALACGCPMVLPQSDGNFEFLAGHHYLLCDGNPQSVERFVNAAQAGQLREIGNTGRQWYLEHADWPVVARQIAAVITAY